MKRKNIITYASIGTNLPSHLIGGGEIGNRRTIMILREAGYNVYVIDKASFGLGAKNYVEMIIQAYIKFRIAIHKDKSAIVFVPGFYERNLWFEWLLLHIAKKKGHKTVYEARNGRLVTAYNSRSRLYKKLMLSLLRNADAVLCQGEEYVTFIKDKLNRESVYIPNYILDSNLQPYHERGFDDGIQLIFFGRLVRSKNVDMIIRLVSELKRRGEKAKLYLVGGATEEYQAELEKVVKEENLSDDVIFMGHLPFSEFSETLKQCHFFVFPSQEIKEGHSNSLTEAMSFGVVPIVSTAGFSARIVDDPCLVIKDIDGKQYADKIIEIKEGDSWSRVSHEMYDRAAKHYTESVIKNRLLSVLEGLEG